MSDDELSEEQQKRMAAKLLAGSVRKAPKVERRHSGNFRPEPVELRFINHVDHYDGSWVYCVVEQKASSGWIKVETFEDRKAADRAAENYRRSGDTVSFFRREI